MDLVGEEVVMSMMVGTWPWRWCMRIFHTVSIHIASCVTGWREESSGGEWRPRIVECGGGGTEEDGRGMR